MQQQEEGGSGTWKEAQVKTVMGFEKKFFLNFEFKVFDHIIHNMT